MSTQAALAQLVHETGYIATPDGRSVGFKVEGVRHCFETFDDDTKYARLLVSFALPPTAGLTTLYAQANEQNQKWKVVKTVIYPSPTNTHVSFSIEMFFNDVANWEPVFVRSIGALRQASDAFFEAVNRLEVPAP